MTSTEAALSELARLDRNLHAWVCLASDIPVEEAPHTQPGPLTGLYVGVKDVMDVRGLPTGHGAALADVRPARFDAACVAMLRAAGARPVGKTVTAEFAGMAPGPTRNPWQPAHTPGGSSSGSAAAVAAGMVPLAIGTQTGGSIIRPAAFNGVVGFKPSFGRVPRTGMLVQCDSLDTIGWFTRDVALARRVAEVFMADAADDPADAEAARRAAGSDLRVAVLPAPEAGTLSDAAMAALEQAAQDLSGQGVQVEWQQAGELFDTALALHAGIMSYEIARGLLPVLQAEAAALRPQTLAVIERGLSITPAEYAALQKRRQHLRGAWLERLSGFDFFLTPSAPGPAPAGHASTGSSAFNRTWSLLGWPALHLPTGQTEDGLPLGVQCVGWPERDMRLLSLAESLHGHLDRRTRKQPELP